MATKKDELYVAVVGSRNYPSKSEVDAVVDNMPTVWTVVSGGAAGVDTWAVARARARGMKVIEVLPVANVHRSYSMALRERTRRIVAMCDSVIAFSYNSSAGTNHAIEVAVELDKPLTVINYVSTSVS